MRAKIISLALLLSATGLFAQCKTDIKTETAVAAKEEMSVKGTTTEANDDTLNQVKLPLGEYMVSEALDDCFIVSSGERYKVVTVGAKPVINDVFDDINLVGDQDAFNIVVKKDNKWGFYNPDGSLITKMIFDNHESIQFLPSTMTINEITYYYSNCYHDGMLVAERDDKYGCLDTTGKEVVPCIYDDILSSKDGVAVVETDGKHGCVDKQGKLIVPCIYDEIDTFHNGKARVKKDDKCGIIDNTGKLIIPCQYDSIWWDEDKGVFRYLNNVTVKF